LALRWDHHSRTGRGLRAAVLIGLYVRDEYTRERFISGYEQVWLETDVLAPGQSPRAAVAPPAPRPPISRSTS
jgi:hypothetical protein